MTIKKQGIDKTNAVKMGDLVSVGDDIRTGKASAVQLTFIDDSFVNLLPESSMRVNQYAFERELNRRSARIRVMTGKARFVLFTGQNRESTFFVETSTAMIVSGIPADFAVSVASSETEVIALNRPVHVKHVSGFVIGTMDVDANHKTIVGQKTAPLPPILLSHEERKSYLREVRSGAAG